MDFNEYCKLSEKNGFELVKKIDSFFDYKIDRTDFNFFRCIFFNDIHSEIKKEIQKMINNAFSCLIQCMKNDEENDFNLIKKEFISNGFWKNEHGDWPILPNIYQMIKENMDTEYEKVLESIHDTIVSHGKDMIFEIIDTEVPKENMYFSMK